MESKRSTSHTYLPPYSIRLLHLNADILHSNAGELLVVPLDEAPPYYALSHCWGPPGENADILIGGTLISVQVQLDVAIQRLRALAATTTDQLDPPLTYVWIDSICINQHNAQERSAQVQMMGTIYARAIRTLVWLGPEFSSSGAAWKLVDDIYDRFREEAPTAQSLQDIPQCVYSNAVHARFSLPPWDSPTWSYLQQLFDLRWFSRVWVIQEVVQSARDPIIIHGQALHSWYRLGWAAAWLRRKGYTRLPQVSQTTLNVDMLCLLRRSRVAWPLDALLSITQVKFHATDPRDKVWSLLGLAAECRPHGEGRGAKTLSAESIPFELRPDYTLSTTHVYQRVSQYLLKHSRSLSLLTRTRGLSGSLSRTRRTTELPGLPSWVPDWSDFEGYNRHIRTSFSWIHFVLNQQTAPPAILGYPKNYAAAAQTELILHDGEEARVTGHSTTNPQMNSTIYVSGIVVTHIEHVVLLNKSPTCKQQFQATFDTTLIRIIQAALSLLPRVGTATWCRTGGDKENIQTWIASLIKATTADQWHMSGHPWELCLQGGSRYMRDILLVFREDILACPYLSSASQADNALLDRILETLVAEAEDLRGDPQAVAVYLTLAQNFCFNRTFLITADGKMGIGPSAAQSGDTVTVLFGAGVPFVLRPRHAPQAQEQGRAGREEKRRAEQPVRCDWHVVGESYVQGLMHGEAIRDSREGILGEEILALV